MTVSSTVSLFYVEICVKIYMKFYVKFYKNTRQQCLGHSPWDPLHTFTCKARLIVSGHIKGQGPVSADALEGGKQAAAAG